MILLSPPRVLHSYFSLSSLIHSTTPPIPSPQCVIVSPPRATVVQFLYNPYHAAATNASHIPPLPLPLPHVQLQLSHTHHKLTATSNSTAMLSQSCRRSHHHSVQPPHVADSTTAIPSTVWSRSCFHRHRSPVAPPQWSSASQAAASWRHPSFSLSEP